MLGMVAANTTASSGIPLEFEPAASVVILSIGAMSLTLVSVPSTFVEVAARKNSLDAALSVLLDVAQRESSAFGMDFIAALYRRPSYSSLGHLSILSRCASGLCSHIDIICCQLQSESVSADKS